RRRPTLGEGQGRGGNDGPGIFAVAQRTPALEGRLTGGLASSVGELDGKGSAGRRNGARRAEDAGQRLLVGVRIKPAPAVRAAPPPLNGGGLHRDHAGPADGGVHPAVGTAVG